MKTTMKKVLSMALALVLVLGMLPMSALATREVAAGGPGCYTANAGTKHTHANCVDGTHTEGAGEFDCVDANNSGYCDLCYGAMHTCEFGTNWVSNGTQHWHECACGAKQNVENHSDPDGLAHNAEKHWNFCSVCNTEYNVANHSGGEATCIAKAKCSTCQREYGTVSTSNHKNTEVHSASSASCNSAGHSGNTFCLDCKTYIATGSEIPATNAHRPDGALKTDNANQHYYVCADCNTPYGYENHVWEAATATTPQICSVCGASKGSALGTATISVKLLIGGTAQNAGSFSITAGGNKTANDILNTYLANSTYSASNISSSYVVDGSSTQYTGNQSVAITAGSTYVLYVTPVNSTNNTQSNTNGIYVSFVPNYNTYTYATYVAGPLEQSGVKLYTIPHNITRTGYTLEGWYYDAALTKKVPTDAVVTTSATFYAKWTQIAPYNVSVVIYTNGNKQTPTVTLDLYEWAQDGVITLADLQQAVVKHGIKANNNAGLSVYGPFTPNQWTSYVSHDYFRNSTERVSVNAGEATVLYAMVHNVKITKGTVDPYGAIADKSNPKTGDMIYAPMMVLGLSASALAVLFYLNKKRAF